VKAVRLRLHRWPFGRITVADLLVNPAKHGCGHYESVADEPGHRRRRTRAMRGRPWDNKR
jgi:hypothetical protein